MSRNSQIHPCKRLLINQIKRENLQIYKREEEEEEEASIKKKVLTVVWRFENNPIPH